MALGIVEQLTQSTVRIECTLANGTVRVAQDFSRDFSMMVRCTSR